jgi:hypothetical protein
MVMMLPRDIMRIQCAGSTLHLLVTGTDFANKSLSVVSCHFNDKNSRLDEVLETCILY